MFKKKPSKIIEFVILVKKKVLMIQIKPIYTKKKQLKNSSFKKIQQVNNI